METKTDNEPKLDHGPNLKEGSDLQSVNPYERLQIDFTNSRGRLVTVKRSETGQEDPFTATDAITEAPVKLTGHERAEAYYQLGLKPPEKLTQGLKKHDAIKRRKAKHSRPPIHSPFDDPPPPEIE